MAEYRKGAPKKEPKKVQYSDTQFGNDRHSMAFTRMLNGIEGGGLTNKIVSHYMAYASEVAVFNTIPASEINISRARSIIHHLERCRDVYKAKVATWDGVEDYYKQRVAKYIDRTCAAKMDMILSATEKNRYKSSFDLIRNTLGIDNLTDENIKAVMPYGSRVYGTAQLTADFDYMFIMAEGFVTEPTQVNRTAGGDSDRVLTNITLHTEQTFADALADYDMAALECYYLPKDKRFKMEVPLIQPETDWAKFITNVLANTERSWKRAEIRFLSAKSADIKEYSNYKGMKSLFHALRVIQFAIQIANTGRINDYSAMNHLWIEMKGATIHWTLLNAGYRLVFDQLRDELIKAVGKAESEKRIILPNVV